jgi:hypothetical protein
MKLRRKTASPPLFRVRAGADHEGIDVPITKFLTQRQIDKMATRPDMILQFAHELARHARLHGAVNPEVYVTTRVSLNGRAPQPIIHEHVNLAQIEDGLGPADWIVPLRPNSERVVSSTTLP